jgi:hypothetical protein
MSKQTAVEWFYQRILAKDIKSVFEQAKEMEREQHGRTWDDALAQVEKRTVWARAMCDFDEYYEETYKK